MKSIKKLVNETPIYLSYENYTSISEPFFKQNPDEYINEKLIIKIENDNNNTSNNKKQKKHKFIEQLPKLIREFYSLIDDDTKEIYINNWTFFSKDYLYQHNQQRLDLDINTIDISLKYQGMGYVTVLFYDLFINKFMIRTDGGSNNIERNYNTEKLKKYCKSTIDEKKYIDYKIIDINNFFENTLINYL